MPAPPANSEVKCATTANVRGSFSLKYRQIRTISPERKSRGFQDATVGEICSRMIVHVVKGNHSSGCRNEPHTLKSKPFCHSSE